MFRQTIAAIFRELQYLHTYTAFYKLSVGNGEMFTRTGVITHVGKQHTVRQKSKVRPKTGHEGAEREQK
jgi:hypothetical protein